NFQLLTLLPGALVPVWNPVWLQFLSHKLFRLLVPWCLVALLGLSLVLTGPVYAAALGAQVLFYGLGLAGLTRAVGARSRLAGAAASFLVLNAAAWLAFWNWSLGRTTRCWGKVLYQPVAPAPGGRQPAGGDPVL